MRRYGRRPPEIQRDTIIARIDPHKIMRKNAMTPLMKVICFAREEHLEAMCNVLVEYGVNYGADERRRYKQRCEADQYDPTYVREFNRSAQIAR